MMVEHVHLDLLGWGRRRPGHTTFLYHWFNFSPPIYFLVSCMFFFFFFANEQAKFFFFFFFFSSREGEAADVSELAAIIMATAASLLQHTALLTGAPGFYTAVKTAAWRHGTSGHWFQNKMRWNGCVSFDVNCSYTSVYSFSNTRRRSSK